MAIAGLDRPPLAGPILEPPTPFGYVRAVLGMPRSVLRQDEPDTTFRLEREAFAVGCTPAKALTRVRGQTLTIGRTAALPYFERWISRRWQKLRLRTGYARRAGTRSGVVAVIQSRSSPSLPVWSGRLPAHRRHDGAYDRGFSDIRPFPRWARRAWQSCCRPDTMGNPVQVA